MGVAFPLQYRKTFGTAGCTVVSKHYWVVLCSLVVHDANPAFVIPTAVGFHALMAETPGHEEPESEVYRGEEKREADANGVCDKEDVVLKMSKKYTPLK